MKSFLIERNLGHVSPEEVSAAGSMSKRVAREQFADSIVWRRSYVTESDAGLSTLCMYESTDEATIRAHASAAGLPCDRVTEVNVIGPADFA